MLRSWERGFSSGVPMLVLQSVMCVYGERWVEALHLELERVKLIENPVFSQTIADDFLVELELLGRGIAAGINENLALVSPAVEYGQLGRGRRRGAADARDSHPVGANLFYTDIVEKCIHVTVQVDVALQLVEELALHGIRRDEAFPGLVLGDHAGSILRNLCDGVHKVIEVVEIMFVKRRVVGSRDEAGTLNQVPGDQCASEAVKVLISPGMPVRSSSNSLRKVSVCSWLPVALRGSLPVMHRLPARR